MIVRKSATLALSLQLSSSFTSVAAIPSIQTQSGLVKGRLATGTSDVAEYLGIPYAQPPVGDLRWAPPQSYNGSDTIDGTEFGYSCPAQITLVTNETIAEEYHFTKQADDILVSLLGQPGVEYSEDCLTLNVWTKDPSSSAKKPVLFWIYGGGFNTGTTNNTGYSGRHIVEKEDVVFVSVNYRLNIFGFPGAPNASNNLGLLDQRLGVEWVRDNIEAFGGDPSRITIFGQSAGGSSVDYYSYAWTADPIVAGFIAESGTVYAPDSQSDAATAAKSWYNVSSTLGCGDASSDPDSVLSCMRSKDWQTIQSGIPTGSGIEGVTGSFGPTIDETVVFSDYIARSAAGNFIQRPMMIGNNENEAGLFKPVLELEGVTYPEALWSYLEFIIYTCPIKYRSEASVSKSVPTWRYRYFGNFPNLKLTTIPDSGAWHGSEIPLILDTDMDIQNLVQRTDAENQIGDYLRGAWVAFATDPESGLTKYGLLQYNPLGNTLLRLGYNNETGPQAVNPIEYDVGCDITTTVSEILAKISSLL